MRLHWLVIMTYGITCGQQVAMKNFCEEIISLSFQEKRCLCYISDDMHVAPYVQESLYEFGVPVILEHAERFTGYEDELLECDGYIVVSARRKYVQRILGERFKPHRRVLIFFEGELDVARLISPPGVDVVVADGLQEDPSRVPGSLRIFSVTKNKTLGGFDDGRVSLRERDFPQEKWVPASPLKISAFNCTPFIYTDSEGGVSDGIDYFVVKQIFGDFPIEFVAPDYTPYHSMYKMVVFDVENDTADLGVCSLWQSQLIKFRVDISYPYGQVCSSFLVPRPYLLAKAWFVYEPLNINLWGTIFSAWLAIIVLLRVFTQYGEHTSKLYASYSVCALHSVRILTFGSVEKFPPPAQTALRIILTSWCLTSLLLTTAYSTGFSSNLTYPRYTKPIKSLRDMIDHSIVSTYVNRNFSKDADVIGPAMLQQIKKKVFPNYEARNERFREHKYAIMVKVLSGRFVTETENLDAYGQKHLVLLSQCHSSENTAFVLRKHSPLKKFVDERMMMLHEFGIIEHWFQHVILEHGMKYMRKFFKIYSDPLDAGPLDMKNLQGIFYLLLTGYAASAALFFIEIYSVCTKKK